MSNGMKTFIKTHSLFFNKYKYRVDFKNKISSIISNRTTSPKKELLALAKHSLRCFEAQTMLQSPPPGFGLKCKTVDNILRRPIFNPHALHADVASYINILEKHEDFCLRSSMNNVLLYTNDKNIVEHLKTTQFSRESYLVFREIDPKYEAATNYSDGYEVILSDKPTKFSFKVYFGDCKDVPQTLLSWVEKNKNLKVKIGSSTEKYLKKNTTYLGRYIYIDNKESLAMLQLMAPRKMIKKIAKLVYVE